MSLEGSIALVTGASRGIGRVIAQALALRSAIVIGTSTTEQGAARITEDLREGGHKGVGMMLDVSKPEAINALIQHINDEYGPVTILVNNAGITRDNLLLRMKESEWEDIIKTNLSSVYYLTKACLKGMIKARRGRVINIASVVGITGNPGQSNYSASKAGIIGFTKAVAQEVGARGITVNTVAPGFIDTDMTRALPEKQRETLLAHIPLKQLGRPQDVANAVAFLASSEAAYITGETLNVNGGMYMP